jgi:hypothetical protein
MAYQHDYNVLLASISSIVGGGAVFEIRCLTSSRRVDAGYFDNPVHAANALLDVGGQYTGIYITPNHLNVDLLARSYNRIAPWAQNLSMDPDVTRRAWLLIDLDAKRPTGISSNDAEHDAALAKGRQISGLLSVIYGWPQPMVNDSGNGCHLMYPMDEPNTDEVRDEIQKFLRCLSAKYSDARVEVDTVNFNAARIWRLPGTYARKGDSTPDRPHRQARIAQHIVHTDLVSILDVQRFNNMNQHMLTPIQLANGVNKNRQEYPDDEKIWKLLNDHAMRRVKEWVPHFFTSARPYKEGYRVASADLGLDFEEDLTIHPWPLGIKYFGIADQGDGTEGRRTPVGLIAEFCTNGDKEAASKQLATVLKAPVTEFSAIPPASQALTSSGGMSALLGNKPNYSFKSIRSVADLQKQQFREVKWIVDNVLPTGNIMLASRPKMRKTWMAIQLAMAISSGGMWMGYQVNKGDVLGLFLEDNERRLQHRIKTLQSWSILKPDLAGFRYWTGGVSTDTYGKERVTNPEEQDELLANFPRGSAGVDALEQYLDQYPNTTAVFIDTYAHFRDNTGNNRDVYQRDYDAMVPITKLCARKNVLIMPVHHEKKGLANTVSGDFMEDVNGSSGISGGVDGIMSIKGRRGVQEENESRKLYISGRDIPHDYEIDISFDAAAGGWKTAQRADVKTAVLELLVKHPFINQKELASLLPAVSQPRLSKVLLDMKFEGAIEQNRFGYSLKRG